MPKTNRLDRNHPHFKFCHDHVLDFSNVPKHLLPQMERWNWIYYKDDKPVWAEGLPEKFEYWQMIGLYKECCKWNAPINVKPFESNPDNKDGE